MKKRMIRALTAIALLLCCACQAAATTPDEAQAPLELLDEAARHLRTAESFRLTIEQTGAAYPLGISLDGVNALNAELRRATGQFIPPDELRLSVKLSMVLTATLDLYARGERQWISFPAGAPWLQLPAFEGFDISRLLKSGDGIDQAFANLEALESPVAAELIDGTSAWHLRARADSAVIAGLLFGLIEPASDARIDVYVGRENGRLSLLDIALDADDEEEPTRWRIEIHDYDAARDFEPPPIAQES